MHTKEAAADIPATVNQNEQNDLNEQQAKRIIDITAAD
jgi:hypothetical protein